MSKYKLTQSQMIALWQRIRDYNFEGLVPPNLIERFETMFSDVSPHMHAFAHKLCGMPLAKQKNWNKAFAERVINQYKRFCFLAAVCNHPVTPSRAVDEAWHCHLFFTRKYLDFCDNILQFALHHEPGFDVGDEQLQYDEQYLQTIEAYKYHFGEEPPQDIWPHRIAAKRYEEANDKKYESSYTSDAGSSDTPFYTIWDAGNDGSIHSADSHGGFGGYSGGKSGGGGASGDYNNDTPVSSPSHSTHTSVDSTHSDPGHSDAGGGDPGGSSCGGGCGGGD